MKRSVLTAGVSIARLSLSACATIAPDIPAVIVAPATDFAAVRAEAVLTTLITSFDQVVSDPAAQINRAKLATQPASAEEILARARSAFEARVGGVSDLVGEAVSLLAQAAPEGASMSARFAISIALAGLQTYATSIDTVEVATPPSDHLVRARRPAHEAFATLRAKLPPPAW